MLTRYAVAGAVLAALVAAPGCGSSSQRTTTPTAHSYQQPPRRVPPPVIPLSPLTTVAQAVGPHVDVYGEPSAAHPALTLDNPQPSGAPLVFLVQGQQSGWLNVLLPVRPNGTTGWISRQAVRLQQHSYRIVVERQAHHITVYQGANIIDQEPVGIGTRDTPTPGGLYYTKELLEPPNPNGPYGPYAYGLSGFSNVLRSFAGGDGVIGIHGTNDPALLGKDVSHGCIRMSNAGITKLALILPLGVPVEILP